MASGQTSAPGLLSPALTPGLTAFIADGGYDPVYGARPLKRFIQSKVETALARAILQNDPAPGTQLTVDVTDGALTVR